MQLLATSDLHVNHRVNREALAALPAFKDDWLIVAGDVSEQLDQFREALARLTERFARVIWTPGNHDLWSRSTDPDGFRGVARYDHLVEICRRLGVHTPEDPFLPWPDDPSTVIAPLFLLFDYSFRPADLDDAQAVAWARRAGVVSGDELFLSPEPFDTRASWCAARCRDAERRLEALGPETRTILVNHWPLRYDLARPPRVPAFSLWSGTTRTETWGQRFRARAVISGHLHLRTTLWRAGVRYDEVSLGYPRDWHTERGLAWYLRPIFPTSADGRDRFVPPRDPFVGHPHAIARRGEVS